MKAIDREDGQSENGKHGAGTEEKVVESIEALGLVILAVLGCLVIIACLGLCVLIRNRTKRRKQLTMGLDQEPSFDEDDDEQSSVHN